MKLSLPSTQLLETLSILSKIPTKHPSLPFLAYTTFQVSDMGLEILVHGIGISGRVLLMSEGDSQPGRVTFESSILMAFLQSVVSGLLTIELVDGVMVCKVGDSLAEIKTYPSDEIQPFPTITNSPWYSGASATVSELLRKVSFAAAATDIRPEFSAVYLAGRGGQLISAATDSFYLAESRAVAVVSEDSYILIPNKYTPDVLKVLGTGSKLEIIIGDGMAQFNVGMVSLVIRTVSGSYPSYEQIIPAQFTATMETLRDDVRTALRTIIPFADQQFPKITLKPQTEDSMCVCETDYNDRGHGRSTFRGLMIGEIFEVRVNADNIMKIMGVIPNDRIVFSFVDPMKPIVITSPDDVSFRALLMPLGR